MTPAPDPYDPHDGDDIDLYDLVTGLWRRRVLVAGVAGVIGLVAIIYAWGMAKSVYSATATARPAPTAMLLSLNEILTLREITGLGESDDSRSTLGIPPNMALERVVGGLGKKDVLAEPTLAVSFEHSRPEAAATLANALLAEAHQRAVAAAVADTKAALDSRLSQLRADLKQAEVDATRAAQDEITRLEEADERRRRELAGQLKALRTKAQKLRADRIQQLEEALAIAQELGLEDPQSVELSARSLNVSEAARAPSINLAVSGGQEYLKGARLLNAELTAVKSRTSEDAFTPEVRELEANLALLESNPRIELLKARDNPLAFVDRARELRASIERLERAAQRDFSSVQFMQLDQPAVVPTRPIRPRRSVIMVAALFTGLMLGVLVALVMNATEARRRAAAEQGASA
jgi:LPS O-antigen subunit length determinant protein (WzzB/FepE family)